MFGEEAGVSRTDPWVMHQGFIHMHNLGATGRGTPVRINRDYLRADLRIVVGNIEPHQFVGFSGGVKSAALLFAL